MEETPQIESNTTEIVLDNQQLIEAVRKQVEYYFSKENLQSDAYLTSQMDAQMTVPIAVVMKFAKMKALTQDESVLRQALENSTITQVVGDKIKANIKSAGRSTIILREIPSDTPLEEVKEIFNYEGCKAIGAIRSDIGDSWFVAMDSEEEAKDTLFDLRLKKRTFRGQPVKARLKTETVIRSFYPLQSVPAVPVGYPPMAFPGQVMDLRSFGYALPADGLASADVEQTDGKDADAATRKESRNHKGPHSSTGNKSGNTNSGNNKKVESSNSGSRTKSVGGSSSSGKKEPVIEINSANFPPLPAGEDTPVPTPGYKEVAFLKYSFEEIIAIVKEVKEAVLPASLNPSNHPFALTATPNLDLLKKQRTYSIDETREQLRQGRPVHREAITAGAVDYRSLMYGDDGQQITGATAVSHTSTTAQQATVTSEQQPVAAPHSHSKHAKGRSNSHGEGALHGQTPKKISASSWAAMVKSSAAATSAAEVASPVKVQVVRPAAAVKPVVATGDVAKKTNAVVAKGGDRKKPAAKDGAARGAVPVDGVKRDRKKPAAKGDAAVKEEGVESVVVVAVSSSEESVVDQTTSKTVAVTAAAAPVTEGAAKAPWGGKTSFASIVKLKSDEAESPVTSKSTDQTAVKKQVASTTRPHTSATAPNKAAGARVTGPNANVARTSSAGVKEGEKRSRPTTGPPVSTEGGVPAAGSNTVSTSGGANASGVWVREVLPSLPKK